MSIDRGMNKEDVGHIYDGILLSHKNNKTMTSAMIWMDLEIVMSEARQTEKDKYMILLIYEI